MNIVVFLKMVPDVVEELKISEDFKSLDDEWLRFKLNESEEHAMEEAIILKEKYGGNITIIALDTPEIDESLYLGLAKGADSAVKVTGDWKELRSPAIAKAYAEYMFKNKTSLDNETLLLAGAQSSDDIEGEMIYYLAQILGIPVDGVVTGITYDPLHGKISFIKEFSGGIRGEFEMPLPAVLGIQAAENPPRYVPIAKIRSVMKSTPLIEYDLTLDNIPEIVPIEKMFEPETTDRAEMLEGSAEEIAVRIVNILTDKALI